MSTPPVIRDKKEVKRKLELLEVGRLDMYLCYINLISNLG